MDTDVEYARRSAMAHSGDGTPLAGSSPPIRAANELLMRIANSETSVLISGETGTGKELAAQVLHLHSRRAKGPFVALNCAAVPETLIESELFGHVKGAFTGANERRDGLLVHAHHGTVFLDEIGDLPLSMQPRLLRALQERVVRPVGGTAEIAFDARVVSASNRDLKAEVEAGRFREDLFYRLDVVEVQLPPLRARGDDVLLLATMFLDRLAQLNDKPALALSPAAAEALRGYTWPGNVRELQNCIERAVALAEPPLVQLSDLPPAIQPSIATRPLELVRAEPFVLQTLAEIERLHILRVLKATGSKRAAAQALGIDRRTLYRKLELFAPGTADSQLRSLC